MTTIIPDSFPFVILPTMSPSANTIRTIMKLENIALFVKISAISFSPLLFFNLKLYIIFFYFASFIQFLFYILHIYAILPIIRATSSPA